MIFNITPLKKPAQAYAVFDSADGSLTFFKSAETYTNNQVDGTKTYYTGIETNEWRYSTNLPWYSHTTEIKSVNIKDKIKPKSGANLFANCCLITSIENIGNLDTSGISNLSSMFFNAKKITTLDLSGFDTSKVTDMNNMFCQCNALTSVNITSFNTNNVSDMEFMFNQCKSLNNLDVSSFDTSKVTSMRAMFSDCESLLSLDVTNFDTSNVTNMCSMFAYCSCLSTIDVSKFNTSNVTDMYTMFSGCSKLTSLDLSNFDTSKVTSFTNMFQRTCFYATTPVTAFCKDAATAATLNTAATTGIDPTKLVFKTYADIAWSTGSDAEICAMVAAADNGNTNLSDYWHVGDERTVHLAAIAENTVMSASPEQDINMVLMNAGGINFTNGKECSFVVGLKNCLIYMGELHTYSSNGFTGSWDVCDMRTWCNSSLKNAFPSTLLPAIKESVTVTGVGNYATSGTIKCNDYFALFAEKQIFGTRTYSVQDEANVLSQITYYNTASNRIKTRSGDNIIPWFTRSPVSGEWLNLGFCSVTEGGKSNYCPYDNWNGIAPYCCI